MVDENNIDDVVDESVADDPFAEGGQRVVPWFWLGLLMIPVVTTMFATVSQVMFPPPKPVVVQVEDVVEEVETVVEQKTVIGRRGGVRGGSRGRGEVGSGLACHFNLLVGRKMTQTLYNSLKATKAEVKMVREKGQRPEEPNNPRRINIYLNDQNVITRVICG